MHILHLSSLHVTNQLLSWKIIKEAGYVFFMSVSLSLRYIIEKVPILSCVRQVAVLVSAEVSDL